MSEPGSTRAAGYVPPAQRATLTADERDRLRRHIAVNVVGDNPPPLTAEARALIRAALGPDQAVEASSAA